MLKATRAQVSRSLNILPSGVGGLTHWAHRALDLSDSEHRQKIPLKSSTLSRGKNCFKTMPPPFIIYHARSKLKKQWTETLRLPVLRNGFGDPMDLLNKSKPH